MHSPSIVERSDPREPIGRLLQRSLSAGCRSPGCSAASQRQCGLAALAAATLFQVPVTEVLAPTRRSAGSSFVRQVAMYIAHVAFGLNYVEIGLAFGRDRSTAAYACRIVEDRRDDPVIDLVIATLEDACQKLSVRLAAVVTAPQINAGQS